LSQKLRDGKVVFVDSFANTSGKTKDIQDALTAFKNIEGFETLNTKKHNNVFMTTAEVNDELKKGAKNIFHVSLQAIENINVLDVLNHRYLVIADPEKTVEFLETKLTNK